MTTGVSGPRWKVEGSAFNGREPDESRANLDLAALDSTAMRFSLLPTDRWALQVSAGHLREAEAGLDDHAPHDVDRLTASAIYHSAAAREKFLGVNRRVRREPGGQYYCGAARADDSCLAR
ncbi:MAG: hypothetical protein Q7R30_08755 [Acidobacteriota bacterium]|nr:hypothetical protein [Acidobacteriota bacterium]